MVWANHLFTAAASEISDSISRCGVNYISSRQLKGNLSRIIYGRGA
jgi:hypothetical protein